MNQNKLILAEKPSVARSIAAVVGATEKKDGYITGNGFTVSWALGHLITLAMPEAYGITGFRRENLPILPAVFKLVPRQVRIGKEYKADPGALKQLNVLKALFGECSEIIVGTDSEREGELIFRYIYNYLQCVKPFSRLWISSLTDKSIREGMEHLKPGSEYDNLYHAAKARSEADFLIGINASQALSIAAAGRGTFSLGRVQTPTLGMICSRFLENKNFASQKYWQLKVLTAKEDTPFTALSVEKYDEQHVAIESMQSIKTAGQVQVKTVERKEVNQEPSLLFDLTSLQKEANTKLNLTADQTLSIAQKLYEKTVLSYPRTGSRYISEDVFEEIHERIAYLGKYPRFASYANLMRNKTLNRRSVNDTKVIGHHALIITENIPGTLDADEQAVYELVAGRMLEAFSDRCVKDVTTLVLNSGNTDFTVKGSVVKSAGWRAVLNASEEGEEEITLPTLQEGEILSLSAVELLEKQTKPKPLHTESSLLSAMENASNGVEDAELKASMKDSGIGTPATRASIIETLFTRQYIIRDKKALVPTEKGLTVYDIVRTKKIADVKMTGMWENTLAKIETGEMNPDTFHKGIEVYATQITAELLALQLSFASAGDCPCPKCKTGRILFYPKVAKCSNVDCSVIVFRNKSDKELTDKQITELLTKGKTALIKGFKSKAGKSFDAFLAFDEEYRVTFVFPEKGSKPKK